MPLDPDHLHAGGGREQAADRGQRVDALDGMGLGLDLLQPHPGGGWQLQRNIACGLAERHDGDAAVVGLGARDDVIGGADAGVPACRRAKIVVDQERDRRGAGGRGNRRIPQRTRGGDDHQRCEYKPQQRQPPRRARRRVLLWLDVEQKPRRRKLDAPRPRRDQPQQPPQHRQAEQAKQHQR
jgi:hypothetical protein